MVGIIDINGSAAREQATKICNANDQLSMSQSVTFSSGTTVPGNASSQTVFDSLKGTAPTIQQLLNRDVANIHTTVETFERLDEESSSLIQQLMPDSGGNK